MKNAPQNAKGEQALGIVFEELRIVDKLFAKSFLASVSSCIEHSNRLTC